MPELPEVNTVMKGFHDTVLHDRIQKVEVSDEKIIRNCSGDEFISYLEGHTFIDTYRQGKYFFAELNNGSHLLFHLGMTGDLIYYQEEIDRPKYERFKIEFTSGLVLGYNDPRKFSDIRIIEDRGQYLQDIRLGTDALVINFTDFCKIFSHRKTTLKAALMDQKKIAGIGNLYADEICFQSKIHPGSIASALEDKHLRELYDKTRSILTTACEREAYYKVYPEDWFWKWRSAEGDVFEEKGVIRKLKIAGRTTYFVDGYQKMIN